MSKEGNYRIMSNPLNSGPYKTRTRRMSSLLLVNNKDNFQRNQSSMWKGPWNGIMGGPPIGSELLTAAKMYIPGTAQTSASFTKILQIKLPKICKI